MNWIILIFAVGSSGTPVLHREGSFASLASCEAERKLAVAALAVVDAGAPGPTIGTKLICIRSDVRTLHTR